MGSLCASGRPGCPILSFPPAAGPLRPSCGHPGGSGLHQLLAGRAREPRDGRERWPGGLEVPSAGERWQPCCWPPRQFELAPQLPPLCTLPITSALLHASNTAGMRQALPGAVVSPAGGKRRLRSAAFAAAPSPPALHSNVCPLPTAPACRRLRDHHRTSRGIRGGLWRAAEAGFSEGWCSARSPLQPPSPLQARAGTAPSCCTARAATRCCPSRWVALPAHSHANRHKHRCTSQPALDAAAPDIVPAPLPLLTLRRRAGTDARARLRPGQQLWQLQQLLLLKPAK